MSNDKQTKFAPTRHAFLRRYTGTKVFFLWFKHKGKRYQKSLKTAIESIAVEAAKTEIAKITEQVKTDQPVSDGKITLNELLEHWLKALRRQVDSKDLKQSSLDSIMDGVIKIRKERPDWLDKQASKISFTDLGSYVHGIRKSQSPSPLPRNQRAKHPREKAPADFPLTPGEARPPPAAPPDSPSGDVPPPASSH